MTIQKMVNSVADSHYVAPTIKELKQSKSFIQATKLSAKLVAGGMVEIAQGAVISGVKLVEAAFVKLFGIDATFPEYRPLDRSRAEASKAFKTALLLATAFAGPLKPQWVASASEKLGLSAKDEHLLRRFWNTVSENKMKVGLGLLAAGALVYDVSQTGYLQAGAQDLWTRLTTDPKEVEQLRETSQGLKEFREDVWQQYDNRINDFRERCGEENAILSGKLVKADERWREAELDLLNCQRDGAQERDKLKVAYDLLKAQRSSPIDTTSTGR